MQIILFVDSSPYILHIIIEFKESKRKGQREREKVMEVMRVFVHYKLHSTHFVGLGKLKFHLNRHSFSFDLIRFAVENVFGPWTVAIRNSHFP